MTARTAITFLAIMLGTTTSGLGDTFFKPSTGETLRGYTAGTTRDGKLILQTLERGRIEVVQGEYAIRRDREGRSNKVIVFTIDDAISLEAHTEAFEKEMALAASEGPLFILVEINTPGGRIDLAQRICTAISQVPCDVVAFVRPGRFGGAMSAGAAITLASDRVYMANGTTIGAATVVLGAPEGDDIESLSLTAGEDIAAKVSSAWQAYMAGLAESNGRPGLLAKAMVGTNVEAVEVLRDGKRRFVEPTNLRQGEKVQRTWNTKGSVLTLTAKEASESGLADKIVNTRHDLLEAEGAGKAEIVENRKPAAAAESVRLARIRRDALVQSIDKKIKQLNQTRSRPIGLRMLREIRNEMNQLLLLGRRFTDLHIDVDALQEEVNTVEMAFKEAIR